MQPTQYEQLQIKAVSKWKAKEPSAGPRIVGVALFPVTWLLNKLVPTAAIRTALDLSSSTAEWLTDTNDIVRDAGVKSLSDLRTRDLEKSDKIAGSVHKWAIGAAVVEGGATGAFGIFGMAADIPAIVVLSLRTIHKIGACYGFEVQSREDRDFVLGVLSSSSANTMEEKMMALMTLRSVEVTVAKQTWKSMAQTAGQQAVGREAGIMAVKSLAAQLGINLTKRKVLQAIPIFGALVGALVNGWYIKQVSWAARRAFQERWLLENGKLEAPIEPNGQGIGR